MRVDTFRPDYENKNPADVSITTEDEQAFIVEYKGHEFGPFTLEAAYAFCYGRGWIRTAEMYKAKVNNGTLL